MSLQANLATFASAFPCTEGHKKIDIVTALTENINLDNCYELWYVAKTVTQKEKPHDSYFCSLHLPKLLAHLCIILVLLELLTV